MLCGCKLRWQQRKVETAGAQAALVWRLQLVALEVCAALLGGCVEGAFVEVAGATSVGRGHFKSTELAFVSYGSGV